MARSEPVSRPLMFLSPKGERNMNYERHFSAYAFRAVTGSVTR